MQSLEVVRPGDGLSTVLSATPYWRDGRRQRQRRHTVATGQWRRLFFGWGTAGGSNGGAARAIDDDGLEICVIVVIRLVFCNSPIFRNSLNRYQFRSNRPVKIGLFLKMLCRISVSVALVFLIGVPLNQYSYSTDCSFKIVCIYGGALTPNFLE
jgi:hypothetical protein